MSELTGNFAEELQLKSMVKLVDRLTKERDELRAKLKASESGWSECSNMLADERKELEQVRGERDELKANLHEESIARIASDYAIEILRRHCGMDAASQDLREVALLVDSLRTRAEQAEAALERRQSCHLEWEKAVQGEREELRAKLHDESVQRIASDYAIETLRSLCGLSTDSMDLREVALLVAELRTRAETAEAKCAEMDSPTWPWVRAFASEMERKLSLNMHKGDREGWIKDSPESLLKRLIEETTELRAAMRSGLSGTTLAEAADVANFAMMIADVVGGLTPHTDCGKGILERVALLEAKCAIKDKALGDCIYCLSDHRDTYPNVIERAKQARDASGTGWASPEKVKRLRQFAAHRPSCASFEFPAVTQSCDCGFAEVILETEDAK